MPDLTRNPNVWDARFQGNTITIAEGKEVHCSICGRLLCKGQFGEGSEVEFKCPRCRNMIRFRKL